MTSRRPTDGDRARRPFSDPLEPFNERPSRASRSQRRLQESARREQATRHVGRLSARHDATLGWRLGVYGLITVGTTLVVWRLTHWIVWAYDPSGAVSTRVAGLPRPGFYAGRSAAEIAASGLANQPEPAAWIDPVGLIVGLAVGLAITWVYTRYFQNL